MSIDNLWTAGGIVSIPLLGFSLFTLLFANAFRGLYLRELAFIQEYGGQLELLNRRFHQGAKKYATY